MAKIFIGILAIILFTNYVNLERTNNKPSNSLELYFLDVGQGDATLLRFPNEKWGLIDTGKDPNLQDKLKAYIPLQQNKFHFVLLTHPDADHIQEAEALLCCYEVDTFFMNDSKKQTHVEKAVNEELAKLNQATYSLYAGDSITIEGVTIDILWPSREEAFSQENNNLSSISIVLSYKEMNLYLFGDLYKEQEILASEPLKPNCDHIGILKASHHGSKTSTSRALLKRLCPDMAIVSAGANNSYGHPHKEVIQMFDEYKIPLYETAKDGDIKIVITEK